MTSHSGSYDAARMALSSEAENLRNQLNELGFGDTGDGAGLDYDSNFADTSQVTAEKGEAASLVTSLRESLEDAERALAKIDKGTFGVCEVCGEAIAPARLEAMPASRYCMTCASKVR